ncbi:MAG: hypothetical protein ACFCU8_12705 [Thermosynechococcaceae cyanobacterium]
MARKGKIMAHTDKLLSLVEQFPQAFSDSAEPFIPPATAAQSSHESEPSQPLEEPSAAEVEPDAVLSAQDEQHDLPSPIAAAPAVAKVDPPQVETPPAAAIATNHEAAPAAPTTAQRTPLKVVPNISQPSAEERDSRPMQQSQKVVSLQRPKPQPRPSQNNLLSLMQEFPQAFSQEGGAIAEAPVETAALLDNQPPQDPMLEQAVDERLPSAEELASTIAHLQDPERQEAEPQVSAALSPMVEPEQAEIASTENPTAASLPSEPVAVEATPETAPDHSPDSTPLEAAQAEETPEPLTLVDEQTNHTEVAASDNAPADLVQQEPELFVPLLQDYDRALQRHIQTFTWGEVLVYFTYRNDRLRSMWVTVGKSGTEVQSLCEAIARLINLLLSKQVPIAEICHQIRGIRGADSEGLGPHRILGLADLIGKALQEAPETLTTDLTAPHHNEVEPETEDGEIASSSSSSLATANATALDAPIAASTEDLGPSLETHPLATAAPVPEAPTTDQASTWAIPEQNLVAMLCPECGAELQHMNGCSGGACPVCGFSSCS